MTDIAKCGQGDCPSSRKCWRFMAPSGAWQTWGSFILESGEEKCGSFVPLPVNRDMADAYGKDSENQN